MWRMPLTCTDDRLPRGVNVLARRMVSFELGALRAPGRLAREEHARLVELLELRLALRAGEPSATQAALAVILLFESSGEHHDARILVRPGAHARWTQGGCACASGPARVRAPEACACLASNAPRSVLVLVLVLGRVVLVLVDFLAGTETPKKKKKKKKGKGWTNVETLCRLLFIYYIHSTIEYLIKKHIFTGLEYTFFAFLEINVRT